MTNLCCHPGGCFQLRNPYSPGFVYMCVCMQYVLLYTFNKYEWSDFCVPGPVRKAGQSNDRDPPGPPGLTVPGRTGRGTCHQGPDPTWEAGR